MHLRHLLLAAALALAAALGGWLVAPEGGVASVEADGPLPRPPIPPRIASGLEYDRCLGLLATEPQAAVAFADAWASRGGGEPARHCHALSRLALGRPGSGAEELEGLAGASASPPATRAALLLQAAQAWRMARAPARAYAAASQALLLTPDDPSLLIERATAAAQLDRHAAAAADLDLALRLDPSRTDALTLQAAALRRLDRIADARAAIDAALATDPDNPEALLERGILRQRVREDAGARADWLRAIDLAPDSAAADLARQNLALLEAGPSE